MIPLSQQICEELGLTYWQLRSDSTEEPVTLRISREEKELLRKILIAKGVALTDEMYQVVSQGIVEVQLHENHTLVFDDVKKPDEPGITHLSALSAMLIDQQQKKLTWYKLKQL